ncbi:hypothetical protein PR048_032361 [Dryococelus australis]|uniref:Uncharacterized protein n=1 Tax=Dryococelus australis TaxID=614101 RepID=A0ABQ9G571_9NEOP|nr:hypothetical protein PR048_032361 [Dryococelus australis]
MYYIQMKVYDHYVLKATPHGVWVQECPARNKDKHGYLKSPVVSEVVHDSLPPMRQTGNTVGCMGSVIVRHLSSKCGDDVFPRGSFLTSLRRFVSNIFEALEQVTALEISCFVSFLCPAELLVRLQLYPSPGDARRICGVNQSFGDGGVGPGKGEGSAIVCDPKAQVALLRSCSVLISLMPLVKFHRNTIPPSPAPPQRRHKCYALPHSFTLPLTEILSASSPDAAAPRAPTRNYYSSPLEKASRETTSPIASLFRTGGKVVERRWGDIRNPCCLDVASVKQCSAFEPPCTQEGRSRDSEPGQADQGGSADLALLQQPTSCTYHVHTVFFWSRRGNLRSKRARGLFSEQKWSFLEQEGSFLEHKRSFAQHEFKLSKELACKKLFKIQRTSKQTVVGSDDDHTTPTRKSKLDIEDETGGKDDHQDGIDVNEYEESVDEVSYQKDDDTLDVVTYFTIEFPSASNVKKAGSVKNARSFAATSEVEKAGDAENTDYVFTEYTNELESALARASLGQSYVSSGATAKKASCRIGIVRPRNSKPKGILILSVFCIYALNSVFRHHGLPFRSGVSTWYLDVVGAGICVGGGVSPSPRLTRSHEFSSCALRVNETSNFGDGMAVLGCRPTWPPPAPTNMADGSLILLHKLCSRTGICTLLPSYPNHSVLIACGTYTSFPSPVASEHLSFVLCMLYDIKSTENRDVKGKGSAAFGKRITETISRVKDFTSRCLYDKAAKARNFSSLSEKEYILNSAGMKGRAKREIPEKTRRLTASSVTIPTCENPELWSVLNGEVSNDGQGGTSLNTEQRAGTQERVETGVIRENIPANCDFRCNSRPGRTVFGPCFLAGRLLVQIRSGLVLKTAIQLGQKVKFLIITSSGRAWSSGGAVARALASHHGDPGSIPGGFAPGISHVGILLGDTGFSRSTLVYPAFTFQRLSILGYHVMSGDYGHLRVLAGKRVTRIALLRPGFTPHSSLLSERSNIEMDMVQRRIARAGGNRTSRENPPTGGIVRHDSQAGSPFDGCERSSRWITAAPCLQARMLLVRRAGSLETKLV